MCVNTIRVAIQGGLSDDAPLVVQRLKTGQPLPAGTMEAMLVLTGEMGGGKAHGESAETWTALCKTVVNRHYQAALRFAAKCVDALQWLNRRGRTSR